MFFAFVLRFLNILSRLGYKTAAGKLVELHLSLLYVCDCWEYTHRARFVLWAICLWISVGIWLLFPFSLSQAQKLWAWVTALRPPGHPGWPAQTQYIIAGNVTTVLQNYSNTEPDSSFWGGKRHEANSLAASTLLSLIMSTISAFEYPPLTLRPFLKLTHLDI